MEVTTSIPCFPLQLGVGCNAISNATAGEGKGFGRYFASPIITMKVIVGYGHRVPMRTLK